MQYYDNYEGNLDGYTIDDLREDLQKLFADGVKDLPQRQVEVDKFLKKYQGYLDEYEENVYKPCINSDGVVSCYMNVPRLLEMLSTYLIRGEDDEHPYDRTYFDHGE